VTCGQWAAPVLHRFCARQHELLVQVKHLKLQLVTLCLTFCAPARVLRGKFAPACALTNAYLPLMITIFVITTIIIKIITKTITTTAP
jgi:hypothetical protein